MKRRYIAILIISLTTWLYACETEMMGYEGESGVYFMMQKPPASGYGDPEQYEYVDTTLIPFAMFTAKDTVLPIRVRITGEVADHDRYFTIRVVDTLTTAKEGEDYEPFENSQVVKAGERQAEDSGLQVKLLRSRNLKQRLTGRSKNVKDLVSRSRQIQLLHQR